MARMAAKSSPDANGTSWSIHWDCCSKSWCIRPISRIVRASRGFWSRSKANFRAWRRSGSTMATPEPGVSGSKSIWDGRWRWSVIPAARAACGSFPVKRSITACLNGPKAFVICHADGWWRIPNHKTPEPLQLTAPTPRPMLGISGLLNLLTWVEHRQLAQASPHEEGGALCPVSYPTQFPPARFKAGHRPVDGSAPDQSSAAPLAPESPTRTPVGTKPRPKQGG
jgi:hypothetical protein